jgi:hypothetical protein
MPIQISSIWVNATRRKTHIYRLKHNQGWVTDHVAKEEMVHQHFERVIGRGELRTQDFNWNGLWFQDPDLNELGAPITEQWVEGYIDQMHGDKAPGPDGFTGLFFKKCWEIIKIDVMKVVHKFENLHVANFHWLNPANIALFPKKIGAEDISDFRPISLIHAIAKIIAKVLALRLGPLMNNLISNAQNAFIKKRSIHDNFLFVKNLAKRLHKNKSPAFLFKLGISKAFDSIYWEYFMDLLQRRGSKPFSQLGHCLAHHIIFMSPS